MRTTMIIRDDLYDEVRRVAREEGRTVTSVVEAALVAALDRRASVAETPRYEVTPIVAGRLRPDVDLDDSVALEDLMAQP